MKIQDRIFYVTGGCSGLGLAVVEDILEQNGLVVILDLVEERGLKLQKEFLKRLIFHRCDIRSESDVLKGLQRAVETWPKKLIGGLIHCAGIGTVEKTIDSKGYPASLETFKKIIDINLTGSFNVARLVASQIVKQSTSDSLGKKLPIEDQGVIILTSSTSYEDGQVGQAAYASSKGGVASLVLPMSRDLARFGIRVIGVAPSLFETSMTQALSAKLRESLLRGLEFPRRFGQPKDFSSLISELIRNEYLNGTVIRIDGATRLGKL
ncbi:hypothetical protein BY996DRAFT_231711 [Phakopsora pachyrhizi]|uniref:3-hydroxyacyl-CoA dehydrogenase type-2 n=1 Tax=Phakopsora pachyrhizi TaxID=170000 RepID=A0AAV0AIL0_PHAPC|nr:hypothetical protein BY996DRAFT_231711 [Phakopsora pachyrhizi]CAH7668065.1 hypothetical protein PPACK8108_LOCUS2534 [Phakopsora pachyrhizi]